MAESSFPDTSKWLPRAAPQPLAAAFERECLYSEQKISSALENEKDFAIDSFESGIPFERIVVNEIGRLLPKRYSVSSGLVLDRHGHTAGKCDCVIFNNTWFSPVRSSVGETGSTPYFAIESVYGVGEVKQSLSIKTLDEAIQKLVTCQRLHRPRSFANRIVENREGSPCPHGLTNPLFTFIVAGSVARGVDLEGLAERFFYINKTLKRLEIVRFLCILGSGVLTWGYRPDTNPEEIKPATFLRDDLFHELVPVLIPADTTSAFFNLISSLSQHLFHVVLAPEDLSIAYSYQNFDIKAPKDPNISLPPDLEWLELLDAPCENRHER